PMSRIDPPLKGAVADADQRNRADPDASNRRRRHFTAAGKGRRGRGQQEQAIDELFSTVHARAPTTALKTWPINENITEVLDGQAGKKYGSELSWNAPHPWPWWPGLASSPSERPASSAGSFANPAAMHD